MTGKAESLLQQLRAYQPADDAEAGSLQFIIDFLEAEAKPFSRKTLHGHITSSGFVVDASYQNVLMVWHRKLERWLQPGGHVEKEDASVYESAMREVEEETGHRAEPSILGNIIFDVDVHEIPARKSEPAHKHLDIRFVFVAGEKVGEPDHELKWLPVQEAVIDQDSSFVRALAKLATLKPHHD
jgi:8-oxo-dGTP pyrophosphatase MutT (NUDIX family)